MPWHCQTPRSYLPKLMTWNSLTLCQVTSWNVNMFCLKEYHKSARKMNYQLISNTSHVRNQLAVSWWAVTGTILTLQREWVQSMALNMPKPLLSKGQHGCSSRHLHRQPVEIAARMVLSTLGKLFKLWQRYLIYYRWSFANSMKWKLKNKLIEKVLSTQYYRSYTMFSIHSRPFNFQLL